ncbi:hypothetical protein ACOMHN_043770 [Nucella lapillus]
MEKTWGKMTASGREGLLSNTTSTLCGNTSREAVADGGMHADWLLAGPAPPLPAHVIATSVWWKHLC